MSPSLLTLSEFRAVAQSPSDAQAPRNLLPNRKITFGPSIPSPATTGRIHDQETADAHQQSLSRGLLTTRISDPLLDRLERFEEAIIEALQLSETMVASDEADPVDLQTLNYAFQNLAPLVRSLNLPPPLVLPLQNGGIGVEWHTAGMNIELRFRKPYDIYAVLEDARNAIEPFHGRDPDFVHVRLRDRETYERALTALAKASTVVPETG